MSKFSESPPTYRHGFICLITVALLACQTPTMPQNLRAQLYPSPTAILIQIQGGVSQADKTSTPTVTPSPTPTITPTPTDTPTATDTPKPKPRVHLTRPRETPTATPGASLVDQQYTQWLLSISIELGSALSDIEQLMREGRLSDQNWVTRMTRQIAFVRQRSAELVALTASGSNQAANDKLLTATTACSEAMLKLDNGVTKRDTRVMNEASPLLVACGEGVAQTVKLVTNDTQTLSNVLPPTVAADNSNSKTVRIIYPPMDEIVTGQVFVTGTLGVALPTDSEYPYYKFEYRPDGSTQWNYLYRPAKQFESLDNGSLMMWDTTTVAPGVYWLQLVVVDPTGNYQADQVRVVVANMQRLPTPTPKILQYKDLCSERNRSMSAEDWAALVNKEFKGQIIDGWWSGIVAKLHPKPLLTEFQLWLYVNRLADPAMVPPDIKFDLTEIADLAQRDRALHFGVGNVIEFTGKIKDATSIPDACTITLESVSLR